MSYPDPPNQGQWGAPGGQYQPPPAGPGYAPAPGPPRRAGRVWLVPVAAGLGVVLMATTVWAANTVVRDAFVGPDPATVLPGSAMVFAELNLQPNGGQLADYARFAQRLPDTVRDEIDPEADPAQEVVDGMIESLGVDMTYEADFEPWLGRRFGVALWRPANENAAVDGTGPAVAIALACEDAAAAEAALTELASQTELHYEVRDDFALLTPTPETLADLDHQVDTSGTLADNTTYTGDMDAIGGDPVASAWTDLGALATAMAETESSPYGGYDEFGYPEEPAVPLDAYENVSGRMAMGVTIRSGYVELRGDAFEVSADGISMADYDIPDPGLDHMGNLPDDTVFAMGGTGLDSLVAQGYEDAPDDFAEFESAMSDLGLTMPEGMTSLLGTRTALGFTDLGGSVDDFFGGTSSAPSFQYRAEGADSAALEEAVTQLWSGSYDAPPGVNDDGSAVVVTSGSTGTGRLGEDPLYQQAMEGTEDAHMGVYVDLEPLMAEAGEHAPEQWGVLGGSVGFTQESMSMRARWAPNGGQ
ncbi:DUF3352 domain-containing protein [Streptomonospora nanhaiensis]|uniref:DUF3352 domain-containing protein n=1 Tax=Streptomonospora nanhaiensis TaxID=1323731 RepID=UPI001C99940B|nr:DUF3352 domain-containing protein [Streptomonospora nanhaiensis]MBX9387029.1 DUF3352 domain-containing protein [Streptomonospora nanhaiensis]